MENEQLQWITLVDKFLPAITALLGAFVGAVIPYWLDKRKHNNKKKEQKKALKDELRANLRQIPDKVDILNQEIGYLKNFNILPMLSVHSSTYVYNSVKVDIFTHLTENERNSLQVIYERYRVADKMMDEFESYALELISNGKATQDPWKPLIGRCRELIDSYSIIETLSRRVLNGEAIDPYPMQRR